jgi:acyl-CoA thioesterase YciA
MASDQALPAAPEGELAVRTIAMPADTSEKTYIFGGWILSQMDLAASHQAWQRTGQKVVTVAADNIRFYRPIFLTDEVSVYVRELKVGHTSLVLGIQVWLRSARFAGEVLSVTGTFSFVAIDESSGKPIPITRRER